jgi:hypothetical protein
MLTHMQRRELELVAEDIVDALDSSWDTFQVMLQVYRRASQKFLAEDLQPDPSTILIGLQAQAYGVMVLAKWSMELGRELGIKYHNIGTSMADKLSSELDAIGVTLST